MQTSLKPGMILQGRYKILSLVGKGGMGYVYKVYGMHLNKELALKEMYDHFVDPEDREKVAKQFQNEAETMAKLEHPGIPRIMDTFEESGRHYIVMEYVEGKTLDQIVMENPQYLMEKQVLDWSNQILNILDYLHNRNDPVVVRDLKPSNIMLSESGIIKIIDFGIAKFFNPHDRTMTAIKGSGSAGFAPPEQYGSSGTDPRSDIYALGVTLYYLLTKVVLPDSVDRILQQDQVYPPSHYNPLVSPALDAMILKMIELRPEDRFQSVREILGYMERENLISGTSPISSTLPKTAVRMENQEVVEEWKRKSSRLSLSKRSLVKDDTPAGKQEIDSEREYQFLSEAVLQKKEMAPEKKESQKNFFLNFVGILAGFLMVFFVIGAIIFGWKYVDALIFGPEVSKTPEPVAVTPTQAKAVVKEYKIKGKITRISRKEDSCKVEIKTDSGVVTLHFEGPQNEDKKVKPGAIVEAKYTLSEDTESKIGVSMNVIKSAPSPSPKPTVIYPPSTYNPPHYNPPVHYTPYREQPAKAGTCRTSNTSSAPSSGGESGGLIHNRPDY